MAAPSSQVVVAAPMSFTGSAQRAWHLTAYGRAWNRFAYAALVAGVVLLVGCWWAVVLAWYLTFGLLLVPYRLLRRGQRRDRALRLRHDEVVAALREPR